MIEKLEVENEVECPADKFYNMWKDDVHEIPKHIPHIFKSVEILEGDGIGVGSVKFWHYEIEGRTINVKEKMTVVDDERRLITHTALGGDILNHYKSFDAKLAVTPRVVDGHVNGSLVKWSLEYEKKNENDPAPTAYLALFEQISKDLNTEIHVKAAA